MVDLMLIGPRDILMAYGVFGVEVYYSTTTAGDEGPPITKGWNVGDPDDEPEEYTQTIHGDSGRMLEITYLVIPCAIKTEVEVRLKLNDLGFRSHVVFGKIKASNKSVHLFSCERGKSWSVPSGSTSTILPLSPSVIALPHHRHLKLHIDVDLTVTTIFDNQEEEDKSFKFTGLKFTGHVRSQEREVDGDQIEVNISYVLNV
ncbi:unnamed protein product [Urochloa humidicola]